MQLTDRSRKANRRCVENATSKAARSIRSNAYRPVLPFDPIGEPSPEVRSPGQLQLFLSKNSCSSRFKNLRNGTLPRCRKHQNPGFIVLTLPPVKDQFYRLP